MSAPLPHGKLAGYFDIEAIEQAFFATHRDRNRATRDWYSFACYLAEHPKQEVPQNTLPEDFESSANPCVCGFCDGTDCCY